MAESLIHTQRELLQLSQHLQGQSWIAIDTEFIRERTYYAQLCLIQVATPERVACIDPLVLDSLETLLDNIYDARILKVFHSARQDIEVLFDLRKNPPTPVFDTQIAAGLLGYDNQISYAALVEHICGIKLEKSHTRTDWASRPLRPEQIRYAEDDVRYLRDLYSQLSERLNAIKRMGWLTEDCARLTDPALYRNDPEFAYQRFKKFHAFSPDVQRILYGFSYWREKTAQYKNLPRAWVLRDATMIELAQTAPEKMEQLTAVKDLKENEIKKWGTEILRVVASNNESPPSVTSKPSTRLTREQAALRDQLLLLTKEQAQRYQLNPTILATRKDIEQILLGETEVLPLQGWRRQIIGETLLDYISRHVSQSAHTH